MKVEAKDIPFIQRFMTEYWKSIKDFYQVETTDEYSEEVCARCEELKEFANMCPDEDDKIFINDCIKALYKLLASKQRGLMKNERHKKEQI